MRGYGRYARGLLTALLAEPSPHEFVFFVDVHTETAWSFPEGAQVVVVSTKEAPTEAATADGRRSILDLWAMTSALARMPLDVLFYPSVYTYFPAITRARIVLGVHDIIPELYPKLVFPSRHQRFLWQAKGWLAHRQADYILTVSDHAKDGIVHYFGWDTDFVWVVGEAPDPVFRPNTDQFAISQALTRQGLDPDSRFIVCLGGLNPHKNMEVLFEAMTKLRRQPQFADLQLVLVGPAESDSFTPGAATARQIVAQSGLSEAVHFTGYLPDTEVACLLNAAQLLAMPSLEEGYGLGAVEAAACGTPVVATKHSPLPQLLAGGGLFVDPRRPQEVTAALAEILGDKSKRQEMGRVALSRAQELTWQRAAGQFLELLAAIEVDVALDN